MVKKEEINMKFTEIKKSAKMKVLKAYNWVDEHKDLIKIGAIAVGGAAVGNYVGKKKGRVEGFEIGTGMQKVLDEASIDMQIERGLLVENYDHSSLEARDQYIDDICQANNDARVYLRNKITKK